MFAAGTGREEMTRYLLSRNASVTNRTHSGESLARRLAGRELSPVGG